MLKFANDKEFLDWGSANPNGFVVNTNRPNANPKYFVLHLACCPYLRRSYQEGAYTELRYQKLAALRVEDFRSFMSREGISEFSKICSRCSPRV